MVLTARRGPTIAPRDIVRNKVKNGQLIKTVVVGVAILGFLAILPDLRRYIRISTM